MSDVSKTFDRLIEQLESLTTDTNRPPDAIDRILSSAPRRTEVRSLRDDPAVKRFREDLTNGLIRVDTAGAVLRLVSDAIGRARGI
jgi:hypothetical protein